MYDSITHRYRESCEDKSTKKMQNIKSAWRENTLFIEGERERERERRGRERERERERERVSE